MKRWLPAMVVLAVALVVWLPTIGWGLPSRDADKYLFGDRTPWTGKKILALTATTMPATMRGADVDADPIVDRSRPVILNDTDAKRAAIVRRYRLMSGQPDEFIQFKALSEMAGRRGLARFDPRLYQYGGLWMYPVGAMVRGAMLVGIIESPPPSVPAIEFYLDRPDAFGRFYVVARFYSWCWGVVAALAIVWLARRISDSPVLATLAAVAFMLTPVVRTATHEAKPHLAGAALCLCAVIAATRYVETGRRRWAIASGALCGAAMAMVVSMLLSVVVLPTMAWLRRRAERPPTLPWHGPPARDSGQAPANHVPEARATKMTSVLLVMVASFACAAVVYAATNPFVIYNAIARPDILRSNLGNSTAMYSVADFMAGRGRLAADSWRIWSAALTPVGAVLASVATYVFLGRQFAAQVLVGPRGGPPPWSEIRPASRLLFWPAALFLAQFGMLSVGKPAEYARFGLVGAAFACVVGADAISLARGRWRIVAIGCVVATTTAGALAFGRKGSSFSVADEQSIALDRDRREGISRRTVKYLVGTSFEPAPWSAPPMNVFDATILLAPRGGFTRDDTLDAIVWPTNLATTIGATAEESVDWRLNRFSIWYDDERHATATTSRSTR